MFLAHYAVAMAVKKVAPRTSLGTTIFASQFLDLLWPVLLLVGLERVRVQPGLTAVSPLDFVSYPISHSLLAVVGWSLLIGVGYHAVRRYPVGGWVVGGLVLSHWWLDVPVHRPDLPLWPGSDILVGGGLWDSIPITLSMEFGLLAVGAWVYLRTTRARDRVGSWGLWAGIAALSLIYLSFYVAAPGSERGVALGALTLWAFVPWGWWVDRHREVVPGQVEGALR